MANIKYFIPAPRVIQAVEFDGTNQEEVENLTDATFTETENGWMISYYSVTTPIEVPLWITKDGVPLQYEMAASQEVPGPEAQYAIEE